MPAQAGSANLIYAPKLPNAGGCSMMWLFSQREVLCSAHSHLEWPLPSSLVKRRGRRHTGPGKAEGSVGMTAVRRDQPMTVEEFLEWDDGRYELVEGMPRLMSPHTDKHATMQGNLSRTLGNHLIARNIPCRVAS